MLNKEKLEQLMAILGDLTEDQKATLTEWLSGPINEKELFEKLGVDEGKFAEFMRALAAEQEDAVLGQELSADEMEAVSGGDIPPIPMDLGIPVYQNCTSDERRSIYEGGFPNCAATVEDGSWCGLNDACHSSLSVRYLDMKDCYKAWK